MHHWTRCGFSPLCVPISLNMGGKGGMQEASTGLDWAVPWRAGGAAPGVPRRHHARRLAHLRARRERRWVAAAGSPISKDCMMITAIRLPGLMITRLMHHQAHHKVHEEALCPL